MIYLDYAAQTPVCQDVLEVFNEMTMKYMANPNAAHRLGKDAKKRIEESTDHIAELLGVKPSEIIYTSGATEANNLAIKGLVKQYHRNGRHMLTTYLEHSSVTSPQASLQREGYEVDFIAIQTDGKVDLAHLKELLRKDTVLISIAAIDSELGAIQPIKEIASILKDYPGCFLHVDATQAIGKMPLDLDGIDLLTCAAHKLYGINGCGLLVKKDTIMVEPILHGGVSTTAFRSGTPSVPLIVAMEKALALSMSHQQDAHQQVQQYNKQLREVLGGYKDIMINSPVGATPYILNISFKGISSVAMQEVLAEKEVYVATKSACCTLNTPSRPVYALTKDRKRALATLRISLSHLTTDEEIKTFLEVFDMCYRDLHK
ncbi:MAG: cysteine desulfurase family protein [Cellulosilyticaceae bacterium]